MAILNVFAILVAGLMVGSELAIAAFVHPTLVRLSDTVHLQTAKRSGARVGEIHAVLVHPCIFC